MTRKPLPKAITQPLGNLRTFGSAAAEDEAPARGGEQGVARAAAQEEDLISRCSLVPGKESFGQGHTLRV